MKVIYPTSLYAREFHFEPSSMWMSAAGWTKRKAIPLLLCGSQTEDVIPDVFIQKGKGYGRKPVYHGKLPPVKVFASQSSMEFWAQNNHLWSSYDILVTDSLFTKMYNYSSNGITRAYAFLCFESGKRVTWAVCEPARGISSNFWAINNIYYYQWEELPNPGSRYSTRMRQYSVSEKTKFPWLGNSSYDPAKVEMAIRANFNPGKFSSWSSQFTSTYPKKAYAEYSQPNFTKNLFGEDRRINGDTLGLPNGYQFDWLVQHAFYDACQGIGKINENSIQNIVQIISDVAGICSSLGMGGLELADDASKFGKKSLKKRIKDKAKVKSHDLVQIADKSSSAWLGYRYSYTTTMMDYKQFVDYVNHKSDVWFNFLDKNYHEELFGTAQLNVDGVSVKCTCQLAYRPRAYEGLKSMCRYIHDAGLELNPYVLWDFVPFSFIVDWAVPLGDVFDVISNQKYYSEMYYDFDYVGFSLKYYFEEEGSRYFRWYQSPPALESEYWFDKGDAKPSGRLILKRSLDVVSLIVG